VNTRVTESFAELAGQITGLPARLGPVRLVAIDGPSGAGKTQFADRLAEALRATSRFGPTVEPPAATGTGAAAAGTGAATVGTGAATVGRSRHDVAVVHTDDLLDGWDDQFMFWGRLEAQVLQPLRHGRPATYQRYLWHRRRFGGVPVTVAPSGVVLLEGVSAARAAIRPELTLSVFVTAPGDLRWRRAVQRHVESPGAVAADRVDLRAYLERWRAAEDRHFAADSTADRVDLLVDGAAGLGEGWAEVAQEAWAAGDLADRYVRLARGHEDSQTRLR
jgi:uridine kinase